MENDFIKFPSKKMIYSAMLVSALLMGGSLPAFADVTGVQQVM